jgi:hypothetical protein
MKTFRITYTQASENMVEVWPTAENMDKPYMKPHYVFECWS